MQVAISKLHRESVYVGRPAAQSGAKPPNNGNAGSRKPARPQSRIGLAICLLLLLKCGRINAQSSDVQDVRIRLYSLQSVKTIALSPLENALWKPCADCRPQPLPAPITLKASGNQLQFRNSQNPSAKAGNSRLTSAFYLTGKYRVQVSRERPLENRYPVKVTARNGILTVILSMPLEDYVAAVLAGESSNFQSDEALKAMAVAARTYAVRFRGRHKTEHFDFCDTTHCQDMRLSAVTDRQRAAVEATKGELLWFEGSPAATYYHQNCGGTTASAHETWPGTKADYLEVRADSYCLRSEHARWESRISKADLNSALLKAGVQVSPDWQSLQVDLRNRSERVQLLDVIGKDGKPAMKLSASTLRFAVGRALGWNQIKSDLYDLKASGNDLLFSGRGSGHGVGLCQEGADAMGQHGKNYREILAFYFPGTALGVSAQGLSWHLLHSEQLDLLTTNANSDAEILNPAGRILHKAQGSSGLTLKLHPILKIYPTLAIYRDSTGEPGWVAASTRGNTIRLQPSQLLQQKGVLDSTLRHEFLHLLVESNTHASLPLWFREGLVLYLADDSGRPAAAVTLAPDAMEAALQNPQNREQMQQVYASAKTTVANMVTRWGKAEVVGWLSRGIAPGALPAPSSSRSTTQTTQH